MITKKKKYHDYKQSRGNDCGKNQKITELERKKKGGKETKARERKKKGQKDNNKIIK